MQTSQGGIVILALLGMVAVSLMTGSVMTGLDAKETVQASYLAESGKEIVRVQTAQQSGGEMMSIARQLEESSRQHNGKGIEIDGKGFVKLTLYPSWFRWYEDKLHLTDSGWYGGVPNGKREMLVLNQNGAMRYAYENGFGSETPGSTAADVYLIGRVQGENGSITYDTTKRTLTVKTTADDLKWFPEYGGLIGLVRQQGKDSQLPTSTQVSKLRFTYDSKKTDGDVHTFTNFIPLSEGTISASTSAWSAKPKPPTVHGPRWCGIRTAGVPSVSPVQEEAKRGGTPLKTLLGETSAVKKISKNSSASTLRSII